MDIVDSGLIRSTIDAATVPFEFGPTLSQGLAALCSLVVIYHFGKIMTTNLLRAGEGFSFEMFRLPIFYLIMLNAWPSLHSFIGDASSVIVESLTDKQELLAQNNTAIYAALDDNIESIEKNFYEQQAINSIKAEKEDNVLPIASMAFELSILDDKLILGIYKGFYGLTSLFDEFLFIMFYFIAKIWLAIVSMGGQIAFTVSILTGGWTVLINWAKTYLSVSLWLPVAAILIGIVNSVMLVVIKGAAGPLMNTMDAATAISPMLMFNKILYALLGMVVLTLIFIGVKIILLAKVPSIISGWISGGGSAGGGFAAAFIPVSMATNTAKMAGGAAMAGATGGASAAATMAKGGFKK